MLCLTFPPALAMDDAFITFRYAANLAAGHGLVFNPGEAFLGTSTPLHALTLGLLSAATGLDVLQAAALLHMTAVMGLAALVWWLLRRRPLAPLAVLFPYGLILHPIAQQTTGMEIVSFLALGFLTVALFLRGRTAAWGVTLGLLLLTRPDGVVLAAVVYGLALVETRRVPWRALFGSGLVLTPWIAYALWTYGNPVPATVAAKAGQAASGLWPVTFLQGLGQEFLDRPVQILVAALATAAAVRALAGRDRAGLMVALWLGGTVGLFALHGVPDYRHYRIVPLTLVWYLALAFLTDPWCPRAVRLRHPTAPARGAAAVATAAVLTILVLRRESLEDPRTRFAANRLAPTRNGYYLIARWLRDNTPPESTVAATEVGILGYYADRRLIDFLGLVTPGVAAEVPDAGHVDFVMPRFRPDYVVGNQPQQGHDANFLHHADRAYDVKLNLGERMILARKPWDEETLARRAVSVLDRPDLASVYFADFPAMLDFSRFQRSVHALVPGLRVDRDFHRSHDHVLQLAHDGRWSVVRFRPETAVRFTGRELARWHGVNLAAPAPVADGAARFTASASHPHLVADLDLPGPFRRGRMALRVDDLPGGRQGASGALVCRCRRANGTEHTFRVVFTVRRSNTESAAFREVVIRLPGPGIPAGETLTFAKLLLLDRRGTVTVRALWLERQ